MTEGSRLGDWRRWVHQDLKRSLTDVLLGTRGRSNEGGVDALVTLPERAKGPRRRLQLPGRVDEPFIEATLEVAPQQCHKGRGWRGFGMC